MAAPPIRRCQRHHGHHVGTGPANDASGRRGTGPGSLGKPGRVRGPAVAWTATCLQPNGRRRGAARRPTRTERRKAGLRPHQRALNERTRRQPRHGAVTRAARARRRVGWRTTDGMDSAWRQPAYAGRSSVRNGSPCSTPARLATTAAPNSLRRRRPQHAPPRPIAPCPPHQLGPPHSRPAAPDTGPTRTWISPARPLPRPIRRAAELRPAVAGDIVRGYDGQPVRFRPASSAVRGRFVSDGPEPAEEQTLFASAGRRGPVEWEPPTDRQRTGLAL